MGIIEQPLWTIELDPGDYVPPRGSLFIYGSGSERRAQHDEKFFARFVNADVTIARVFNETAETMTVSRNGIQDELWLYNWNELASYFLSSDVTAVVLEVTGLAHRTWAPILGSLVESGCIVHVVYTEPLAYQRSQTTRFYNLSDSVEGISPLPGFERILPANREVGAFVPMIGFEGPRLQHVMENVETDRDKVYPVIGLPAFRPGFQFQTYLANRTYIEPSSHKIHYAKANCPFDAFHTLERVFQDCGGQPIRIAPIGTKPHGIGAVLFALSRGDSVELIYDHPLRSERRTVGEGRLCVYDVSSFVASSAFSENELS